MAEQRQDEPHDDLAAELADLRQRVVQLESVVLKMLGLESVAEPPPPPPAVLHPAPPPLEPLPPSPRPVPGPKPAAASPRSPAVASLPKRSLEQTIGTRWLLFAGVAVLLLSAVFFFKYAIDRGWLGPHQRVLIGALTGLAMLAGSEWAFRRGMKLYAGAVGGAAVALLYIVVFVASPNGLYARLDMLGRSMTLAFVLMCAVTLIGAGAALRSGIQPTAVIALLGALATPVLLSSGRDRQVVLMTYLLIVDAGFLAVAWAKAWRVLVPIAMAGTGLLFAAWFNAHYPSRHVHWVVTNVFQWSFFALFVAYGVSASARGANSRRAAVAITALAAIVLITLWCAQDLHAALAGQLLVLNAVVLALCAWRHWYRLRLGVLAWTMLAMASEWACAFGGYGPISPVSWCVWAWVLFALGTADVVLRVCRAGLPRPRRLDPALASVGMAAMFAGTYALLDADYHAWMGLYAAALGAGALAAGWVVTVRRRWPALGYAYFAQGLVLIALAVPIQFELAMVTIAWGVQGVVAMALARRLGSRALVGKSVAVLALAVLHFLVVAIRHDARLRATALSCGAVGVSTALLLATGLTVGILAAAAVLRAGKAIRNNAVERKLAALMTAAAAVFFMAICRRELPPIAATWWWMALAAALAAWALARRSDWLTAVGGVLVLACAVKWMEFDTLTPRMLHGADVHLAVVMNWPFWTGLALAAMTVAYALALERRGVEIVSQGTRYDRALTGTCIVMACVMVVWAGSFEIDRFFAGAPSQPWSDPAQARHMALSLWWAVWAAVVLAIGFVASRPALRYLAFALFAVTLGKVFIVDMRQVRTVYRVMSFLGLGVTLLGGALLYNRRSVAASSAGAASAEPPPQTPPPEDGSP